jgi:hypothetical protein
MYGRRRLKRASVATVGVETIITVIPSLCSLTSIKTLFFYHYFNLGIAKKNVLAYNPQFCSTSHRAQTPKSFDTDSQIQFLFPQFVFLPVELLCFSF